MKKIIACVLILMMALPMGCFGLPAEELKADTSWYDASKTQFVLTTVGQLLGFSELSKANDFAGKTVKLGADLTMNAGDSDLWEKSPPANVWTPVYEFSGTFDGQGHTLSGFYGKQETMMGLFRYTKDAAVVKNLKLVNSYFETTDSFAAAISTYGAGTFDSIYTDVTIVCGGFHPGGIFGVGDGKAIKVNNCWFDGYLELQGRFGGGIVGNGNGVSVTVTNCLNSGVVYSARNEANDSNVAGIVGRNDADTRIENCLNVGSVSTAYQNSGKSDTIGSLMGACWANYKTEDGSDWISKVNIVNSFASSESCYRVVGDNSSGDPTQKKEFTALSEQLLKGYNAYVNTTLDFDNTWAVNVDGFPVLKTFAETVPPLFEMVAPSLSESEVKAEDHYGPRWTLTLPLPEGLTKKDVTVGALIVPTKAIPQDHFLTLEDNAFTYRGKEYPVANVEGKILRESKADEIVASFVVTDLSAVNARTSFTALPYALYSVDGSESVAIYGQAQDASFYKEAVLSLEGEKVDKEYKTKLESVLAPIDRELGGRFPVSEVWSEKDLFEEIPAFVTDHTTLVEAVDYGVGNYVITADGATNEDYVAYLKLLEQYGFKKIVDNGAKGIAECVYTATYTKGDLVLTVTNTVNTQKVYVSAMWDLPLSEHLFDNFSKDVKEGAKTKLIMNELWYYGTSVLIQLKNGHFLMNDGATEEELGYLLDTLEELTPGDEKPVIEGWFVTHLHRDHFHVLKTFLDHPEWADRVVVEGFYFSEPSDAVKDLDKGVYAEIENEYKAIELLKDSKGETPKIYRPRTGQRYYFSDITVDIMLTQEQILLEDYEDDFNDSSSWYRFNIEGQSVIHGGDSGDAGMSGVLDTYDPDYLVFDVFISLHHGSNTMADFTDTCKFKTILHPYHIRETAPAAVVLDKRAIANGGEALIEGEGSLILTFPYSVGSYEREEHKEWIYHTDRTRPWND